MSSPVHNNKIPTAALRVAGFAFTALTVPLAGVKLFTGSNNDSFWSSWKALGLLTLGAAASFGASTLSPNQAQTTSIEPSLIKLQVEAPHTKQTSTETESIAREMLQNIISNQELYQFLTNLHKEIDITPLDSIRLSGDGVKLKTLKRNPEDEAKYYLQVLHDSNTVFCKFYEEDGKKKILSLRVEFDELISALEFGAFNQVSVQLLKKDEESLDSDFEPYGKPILIPVNVLKVNAPNKVAA